MLRHLRALPWVFCLAFAAMSASRLWIPAVGTYRDDGIYLSSARALAKGAGYSIDTLPGCPRNTKYPPLTSVMAAPLFWAGLAPTTQPWIFKSIPFAFLGLWLLAIRRLGTLGGLGPESIGWILACTLASDMVAYCGTSYLSDVPAAALLSWGLVFVLRSVNEYSGSSRLAASAGLLMGLSLLTRTSLIAACLSLIHI